MYILSGLQLFVRQVCLFPFEFEAFFRQRTIYGQWSPFSKLIIILLIPSIKQLVLENMRIANSSFWEGFQFRWFNIKGIDQDLLFLKNNFELGYLLVVMIVSEHNSESLVTKQLRIHFRFYFKSVS